MKRLSWLPTEEDIQMSLPVICKFVSWVDGNKSDSTTWMSSDYSFSKYHQTTTSGNCHHLKKVYNFILEGAAINLVGYGELNKPKTSTASRKFWMDCTRGKPVYTLDKIVGTINFRETHYSMKCKSCVRGNAGLACLEQCKCQRSC